MMGIFEPVKERLNILNHKILKKIPRGVFYFDA
jgi:hypothetical protein